MASRARLAGMVHRSRTVLLAALLILAGCRLLPGGIGSPGASVDHGVRLTGRVVAGPTCPVVTEPPQSGCAERPVSGAVLLILDAGGRQVGRVTSGADGSFGLELPPGRYRVVPQPVQGLMGTAPEQDVTLDASSAPTTITYDTGIR